MPVIRISDSTFKALQSLAVPLIDTPGSVIDKLVKAQMEREGKSVGEPEDRQEPGHREFDPLKPPGLTHTTILEATVDGQPLERPRWSACLIRVIGAVKARGFSGRALVKQLNVQARPREYAKHGFKYYPSLGLSVQGQSAQDAWKEISRLATAHDISVGVLFKWRSKEGADYPGTEGTMAIGSPS